MKKLKILPLIAISIVPVFNSIIAVGYGIYIKRYSAAVYAGLFLIATVVLLEMDTYETNQYLIKTYEVEKRSDLEVFRFEDISFRFPKYSLIKTSLSDGYHEEVKTEKEKEYLHKITVVDGKYTSYFILDKEGNLVEDRLKKLYDQQLANYKKDNPDKKVVFTDTVYRSYYGVLGPIFIIISMLHCFFTLRKRKEDTVTNNQNPQINIKPSKEIEAVIENEENIVMSFDDFIEDQEDSQSIVNDMIDVNKADQSQFAQLEGISTVQALYFIKEREDNGRYTSVSDFFERNSISDNLQNTLINNLSLEDNIDAEDTSGSRGRVLDF